jgi:hypothetical protein
MLCIFKHHGACSAVPPNKIMQVISQFRLPCSADNTHLHALPCTSPLAVPLEPPQQRGLSWIHASFGAVHRERALGGTCPVLAPSTLAKAHALAYPLPECPFREEAIDKLLKQRDGTLPSDFLSPKNEVLWANNLALCKASKPPMNKNCPHVALWPYTIIDARMGQACQDPYPSTEIDQTIKYCMLK